MKAIRHDQGKPPLGQIGFVQIAEMWVATFGEGHMELAIRSIAQWEATRDPRALRNAYRRVVQTVSPMQIAGCFLQASESGKYPRDNWRTGGLPFSRVVDPLARHLMACIEAKDAGARTIDSGLRHLAHAGANLGMLITYTTLGLGEDDWWQITATTGEKDTQEST